MSGFKWTDEEINVLKENYSKYGAEKCMTLLNNRTYKSIKKMASTLNISCNFKWTDEENDKLKNLWYNGTKQDLLNAYPNLSYSAILGLAMRLKLLHNIIRTRHGDLSFLNNLNSNESYYWWGFIMADGCLSKRNDLIITISDKDINNLLLLATKLNTNITRRICNTAYGNYTSCTLRIKDLLFCTKWKNILNIMDKKKTYNAPNLSIFYNKEYLIYFLIGLLDGDGCISKSRTTIVISISNHISWKELYKELFLLIEDYYNIHFNLRIDNHGCIQANLCKKTEVIKLYHYAILCSDILHRKWDKIKELFNI